MEEKQFKRVECVYKPELIKNLITDKLDEHISKILEACKEKSENTINRIISNENEEFVNNALEIMPAIKHEKFEEEKECRFYRILEDDNSDAEVCFREGKSMVIPYIEVELPNLECAEIYVGPTPHEELSKESIRALLSRHQMFKCCTKVKASQVPYRAW